MEYTVAIKTGDVFGAGTEANVFIRVTGELGVSGNLTLNQSINGHRVLFVRNQSDIFSFNSGHSLGPLKSVTVWHDGSATGFANAWFLEEIQILDHAANIVFVFPCKRWLAENKDDYKISRDLPCTTTKVWRARELEEDGETANIIPQEEILVEGKKKKMKKMHQAQAMGMGRPGMMGGYGAGYPQAAYGGYGAGYGGGYGAGYGGGYGAYGGYGMPMGGMRGAGMMGMGMGRMMRAGSWSWSWS